MLISILPILQLILRSYLVIIFLSVSFSQYFIVPQRPIFDLLKWEEINSNKILIPKVGPIINTDLEPSHFMFYYYPNMQTNGVLTGEIFSEVSVSSEQGPRLRLFGTAAITMNDKLMIQNEFEFDNKGESNAHFQGIERGFKNGWVGYLQHSSLIYNYVNGHLSIGRGNPYYNNINESLLINPHFPSVEYIWWQHENHWFQFDWGFMMLSPIRDLNRFINFHRYGLNTQNYRIGFTEAVMGTYENWSVYETGYVLPAAIHFETEENRGINTNLIWLIDGMLKWRDYTFYGEILIDDFALDKQSPPQLAGSIGLGRKLNQVLVNAEYTRINRWTGNYCRINLDSISTNVWIESGIPIGHSIGSDAHQFMLSGYLQFNQKIAFQVSYILIESGNGMPVDRLYDWPDDVSCETNFGYNKEAFPTSSNINLYSKTNFYYLIRDWIMVDAQIALERKKLPDYMVTLTFHID